MNDAGIRAALQEGRDLTPAERQLATAVLRLGDHVQDLSIKQLAKAASCSVSTVHRLCHKIGLEGYKSLKVELARASELEARSGIVDINFPFSAGWDARQVSQSMGVLYTTTVTQTNDLMDAGAMDRAARIVSHAARVNLYTESHNVYPAQMFMDRLLSIGHDATCHTSYERQVRSALRSDERQVAIFISYSGVLLHLERLLPLLAQRHTPTILIGTPAAARRNPGLDVYLAVSDAERYQGRITQFASHLAVHYVLDVLFGCVFALDWDNNMAFLEQSLPYTRKV